MTKRPIIFALSLAMFLAAREGVSNSQEVDQGSRFEQADTGVPILDVTVQVDFGEDLGQNFGSLFEAYDNEGNVIAGAGFLGAYNTQPRSDRGRLHFFIKPKQVAYTVESLPRVNDNTGIYLSSSGESLHARTRNGRDAHFYLLDQKSNTWQVDDRVTSYDINVAGEPLQVSTDKVIHAGEPVLVAQENTRLLENYYAAGQLVLRVQDTVESDRSNRLVAYHWSPYEDHDAIASSDGVAITLRSHREFVYAFGQLDREILAATNTGGVYAFDGKAWKVIVEPGPHSYQVYTMLNYYDRLLLGHYPTGELYEYDGQQLRHLPGWPPVMPGVSNHAREAQTLTIYGGDLYVGVWPWGEVWRRDHNDATWQFARRMFDHPEPTDATIHPYENETKAVDPVANLWGQRITSLVPFGESLYVSTSSKAGPEFDPKFEFLADGKWKDYGRVYRLTLPGQLSAAIPWREGPTTFRCTLTNHQMTIRQDGILKATTSVNADKLLVAPPSRIAWGRGVYGQLDGDMISRHSNLDRPYLGAYLNFSRLFASLKTTAERERAMDVALDRFCSSGLNTVMPYVTSSSGSAAYPSNLIAEHQYNDWDPLAYLTTAARERELNVYPVFCVLSCGYDEPRGILLKHPDWALRTPEGKPEGHISPANANARLWITEVIDEVVQRYRPEGVMLDYLRYCNRPTRLDARGEAALKDFETQHPGDDAKVLEQHFREQELTKLARSISRAARRNRPDLQVAIYSWGPHVARNHHVAQAWPDWSRKGYVDMVNISGYCYPDNYGERYLDVFSSRLGEAVRLNQSVHGRADITFCLGVVTSHGKIQSANWIDDYLTRAAAAGVSGAALFTWSSAVPFLDEVDAGGYVARFVQAVK